jgi:hypothetical protein
VGHHGGWADSQVLRGVITVAEMQIHDATAVLDMLIRPSKSREEDLGVCKMQEIHSSLDVPLIGPILLLLT